ncbi:SUMF1/EgtB/PvdO family nonheme iron enzyme [Nocardia salmonicida]|uniref:SUMF1/EgtB/PvdO family nonheme iron enzyme n=1 Tax=Nocardia salmonicida TaxID=53431 RepID=UPI0033E3AEFE
MVATVKRWTGAEALALRNARRMSLLDFAAHLGVAARTLSKWDAGGADVIPNTVNQTALDTSLSRLTDAERERFVAFVGPNSLSETRDTDVPEQATLQRHPGDGKLMVWIPEGVFLSGATDEPAWTDGYWVDVFPTTNGDYARFVAATGHSTPRHWDGAPTPPPGIADHPVVWVSSEDADAYASWARKRLPSSLQWEKAARGTRGNVWPWGNQPTPAKANVRGSGPGTTTPVDTYKSGTSAYGIYDLVGGVWEWCSSATVKGRELKGGAFTSLFEAARPSAFNDARITMADDDTGFRCVATTLAI